MADKQSPEERAAIDAYMAEHGATVIPRGVSSFEVGEGAGKFNPQKQMRRGGRVVTPWSTYVQWMQQGLSTQEMAKRAKVAVGSVSKVLSKHGFRAADVNRRAAERRARHDAKV